MQWRADRLENQIVLKFISIEFLFSLSFEYDQIGFSSRNLKSQMHHLLREVNPTSKTEVYLSSKIYGLFFYLFFFIYTYEDLLVSSTLRKKWMKVKSFPFKMEARKGTEIKCQESSYVNIQTNWMNVIMAIKWLFQRECCLLAYYTGEAF